ncbi:hypothetical protein SOVF_087170 [Spinacia oleracea]|uniref:Sulfhydryl oxidase n=1 Tax=Spinacia oleracea TaxID=3562 RepID=A0A9R0K6T5_SPIOL|nr:FAD-linked sulfhydryl oxidase ERV1 [Spinacia oleracea]KNA16647.1 hypothetical protein SOVF_087170 [Spinacia oleracea]
MSENPLEHIFQTFQKISICIQTQLFSLAGLPIQPPPPNEKPLLSLSTTVVSTKGKASKPVTKEDLGRSTWTFLHTLAAQYPERPTRQQKKDVKELMAILSRMYPCKECADHFNEVLRANPVQAGSQAEFSQWMCHVHNVVNRSLSKPIFPCERVDARWGKLDCEQRLCDLQGTTTFGDDI